MEAGIHYHTICTLQNICVITTATRPAEPVNLDTDLHCDYYFAVWHQRSVSQSLGFYVFYSILFLTSLLYHNSIHLTIVNWLPIDWTAWHVSPSPTTCDCSSSRINSSRVILVHRGQVSFPFLINKLQACIASIDEVRVHVPIAERCLFCGIPHLNCSE